MKVDIMLYSMQFQNLGIHQQTKIWDNFKLAIRYDTAMTTLCQFLGYQGFWLNFKPKAEKIETYCQLPIRFLPEFDRLVVQLNGG